VKGGKDAFWNGRIRKKINHGWRGFTRMGRIGNRWDESD
jgi:hypothetical protein